MNTNYSVNQPAFSARLKLNDINLDRAKLAKAEETFSKLTQHYKNDELVIQAYKVDRLDGTYFNVADFIVDGNVAATSEPLKEFKHWFSRANAQEMGKAFARIFKKGKLEGKEVPKLNALDNKLTHLKSMAALNNTRAEISGNPTYSILAKQNNAAAERIQKEFSEASKKLETTTEKIKDFESDIPIMDWDTAQYRH